MRSLNKTGSKTCQCTKTKTKETYSICLDTSDHKLFQCQIHLRTSASNKYTIKKISKAENKLDSDHMKEVLEQKLVGIV